MTIIISPAKKLTPTNNSLGVETTKNEFPAKLNELVDYAKSLSEKDLIDKMKISPSLARLNFDRFQNIEKKFPMKKFTPPPQCMPDEYKHENYITAYRQYYIGEKKRFAKYTRVDIPDFMC